MPLARRDKSCAMALCVCFTMALTLLSIAKNADIIGWMSFTVVAFVLTGYFLLGALMDRFLVYHMPTHDNVVVIENSRLSEGFNDPHGRRRELINRICPMLEYEDRGHEETCVVCLDQLEEGDYCRVLFCEHVFHKRCIDSWWLQKPNSMELKCPMCRQLHRPICRQHHRSGFGLNAVAEAV